MRKFSASAILAAVALCVALAPCAEASDAATTCRSLNLSPTAVADCEQQLDTALTDADRAKVVHIFAMGLATAKADAIVSQLAAQAAPAAQPAAGATAEKSSGGAPTAASTTQNLATPQQKKATTAAGGERTGTKAGSQHTETVDAGDKPPSTAKPKAQKTSHQPAGKTAKKSGQ